MSKCCERQAKEPGNQGEGVFVGEIRVLLNLEGAAEDRGTIGVTVMDAVTGRPVWGGTVRGLLKRRRSDAQAKERLRAVIAEIFAGWD